MSPHHESLDAGAMGTAVKTRNIGKLSVVCRSIGSGHVGLSDCQTTSAVCLTVKPLSLRVWLRRSTRVPSHPHIHTRTDCIFCCRHVDG